MLVVKIIFRSGYVSYFRHAIVKIEINLFRLVDTYIMYIKLESQMHLMMCAYFKLTCFKCVYMHAYYYSWYESGSGFLAISHT